MRERVATRLAASPPGTGLHVAVLLLAMAGYLTHFTVAFSISQPWYIEDSAISFAYAKHWVEGDGLVPYVGGERVEGYSNALWTFLIGIAYAVGVSPWTSSKVMGALFGCVAQAFSWGLARRMLPEGQKGYALLAPILLAGSTQFTLWNASGLENGLFCMLLAAGLYGLVVEVEDDRATPWSALAFFGLAMTRPDGLAYLGIGLIGRTLGTIGRRQWKAWIFWVLAAGLPWLAYNFWRYEYFAWEWPNTWYAKKKNFKPFDWNNNYGYKQMREYFTKYWIIYFAPAIALAVGGVARWRRFAVAALLVPFAVAILWDGKFGSLLPATVKLTWWNQHYNEVRVWTLGGVAALLGLVSLGQPGWIARGLLWCCYTFGLFYTVLATGDWMKGLRWYNLTSVPQFILLAVGIGTLADLLPLAQRAVARIPLRAAYATVMVGLLVGASIPRSIEFVRKPETAPRDVHKRVNYMAWVQSRLDLDRVTLFDVDMGAHTWYTDWWIADIAGLIDVPMAQHDYEKPFLKEYLFEEVRPDFAHVHGSWARTIKISAHPEWKDQYVEIPGYPTGRTALHVGNHVRKDHLAVETPPATTERLVRFGDQVQLESWNLPATTVAPGGQLFVDTLWRAKKRDSGLRVLLFLAGEKGVAWSAEVAPGYDWYRPERWEPWEYVKGRWSVQMPESLPRGDYRLGVVLLDEKAGVVLPFLGEGPGADKIWMEDEAPVEPVTPAATTAPALYMTGEYLLPGTVHLVSPEEAREAAEAALDAGRAAAERGECDDAFLAWKNARRHVANNRKWQDSKRDDAVRTIVGCYVDRAENSGDDLGGALLLRAARFISPRDERVAEVGAPVGERLEAAGDEAALQKDWDEAYIHYRAALAADPTRSWARRKAEDARDRRLKIRRYDPKSKGEVLDPDTAPLPRPFYAEWFPSDPS